MKTFVRLSLSPKPGPLVQSITSNWLLSLRASLGNTSSVQRKGKKYELITCQHIHPRPFRGDRKEAARPHHRRELGVMMIISVNTPGQR